MASSANFRCHTCDGTQSMRETLAFCCSYVCAKVRDLAIASAIWLPVVGLLWHAIGAFMWIWLLMGSYIWLLAIGVPALVNARLNAAQKAHAEGRARSGCSAPMRVNLLDSDGKRHELDIPSAIITPQALAEHIQRAVSSAHLVKHLLEYREQKRFCTVCGHHTTALCMACDPNGTTCAFPGHCPHARLQSGHIKREELGEYLRVMRKMTPYQAEKAVKEHAETKQYCTKCSLPLDLLCMLCDSNGTTCPNAEHCKHERVPTIDDVIAQLRRSAAEL